MVHMRPKRLNIIIALPVLLMINGTSSWANSGEIRPRSLQPERIGQTEVQTLPFRDHKILPEIFYDRTPCKLYGQC